MCLKQAAGVSVFNVLQGLVIVLCFCFFVTAALAQNLEPVLQTQEQAAPDPAQNRAAFISFVQGSLESGFMDEWRGAHPMKTMDEINKYLSTFNLWAYACQDAPKFALNAEETTLLNAFRKKAQDVQNQAFPKLRDAFGPILRQQAQLHNVSARTVGLKFKLVEFYGQPFSAMANINQFNARVRIALFQLRFEKADYKLTRNSEALRSIEISAFKDSDMVVWHDDTEYEVIP